MEKLNTDFGVLCKDRQLIRCIAYYTDACVSAAEVLADLFKLRLSSTTRYRVVVACVYSGNWTSRDHDHRISTFNCKKHAERVEENTLQTNDGRDTLLIVANYEHK